MTRYLTPSEDVTTEMKPPADSRSVARRRRLRGTAWSLATMTFAIGVTWLIVRSMMI